MSKPSVRRQHTYKNPFKRKTKRRQCYQKFQNRKKETPEEFMRRTGIAEHREIKRITRLLLDRYGAKCAICGKEIRNKKDLTLDHIRPLSKGGTTTLENCQLACLDCNQRKADKWNP